MLQDDTELKLSRRYRDRDRFFECIETVRQELKGNNQLHSMRPEPQRRLQPRLLKFTLVLVATTVLLFLAASAWLLIRVVPDPIPEFIIRKGEMVDVRETGSFNLADSRVKEMTLVSSSGLEVEFALRVPHQPLPGRPVLIMIAGRETGRDAVQLIPNTRGVIVAALSYFYEGDYDNLAVLLELRRFQQAVLDTPPAVMLVLDYLLERPEIRPGPVELAGVSFGAFIAAVPGVLDPRIQRVWLIHGAGDVRRVLDSRLVKDIRIAPLRRSVAQFLAAVVAAHHLSPEKWVGRLSPRPVIVVNARSDKELPEESVRALHDALQKPFEVMWTPGGHVSPKRQDSVLQIVDLMFSIIARDASLSDLDVNPAIHRVPGELPITQQSVTQIVHDNVFPSGID